MAGFDYAASAATALRLLQQFGGPMVLSRPVVASSDPVAGTVTEAAPQSLATTGVRTALGEGVFEGARIEVGDQMWLLSSEVEPAMSDKLVVDGVLWTIAAIQKLKPAAVPLLYKVLVRNG